MFSHQDQEAYRTKIYGRFSLKDSGVHPILGPIRLMSEGFMGIRRISSCVVQTLLLFGRRSTAESAVFRKSHDCHRQAIIVSGYQFFHFGFIGRCFVHRHLAGRNGRQDGRFFGSFQKVSVRVNDPTRRPRYEGWPRRTGTVITVRVKSRSVVRAKGLRPKTTRLRLHALSAISRGRLFARIRSLEHHRVTHNERDKATSWCV